MVKYSKLLLPTSHFRFSLNNEHISTFDFLHLISMNEWAEIQLARLLLSFYNFAILPMQKINRCARFILEKTKREQLAETNR